MDNHLRLRPKGKRSTDRPTAGLASDLQQLSPPPVLRGLALLLVASAVIATLCHFDLPAAAPVDAPARQFSEGRARAHLEGLVALGSRVVGSYANEVSSNRNRWVCCSSLCGRC